MMIRHRSIVLSTLLATSVLAASALEPDAPIPGFGPPAATAQRTLEEKLKRLPLAANSERHHRFLTEEPHIAGTPGAKRVADYVYKQLSGFGIETEMVEYDVLLSYPKTVELELTTPEQIRLANREAGYEVDKDSFDSRVTPPWHAYAASGEVEGQVVYLNHGRSEDYDKLDELGVDYRGKIGLARYFRGYRGGKSMEAEKRGLKALIVYSDPAEDGYVQGDAYPNGPWGPASKVQRGANVYDFLVPGDPLTPGWASTKDARRIPAEESRVLPKIPTLPLSYADAAQILGNLAGPAAPTGWQGGLPFTYHTGPGPAEVRLKLEITRERRPIYNVIGRIRGRSQPEQLVILSNHHDAWEYGGVDPSSGTATLIELGRVFGELLENGWRPERTIVLGAWDAEEYTLTGSTEWGEENAQELRRNAVVCLNVDSSVSGNTFAASAVPSLRRAILEATRSIDDPVSGRSVFDRWAGADTEGNIRGYAVGTGSDLPVDIGILGSGSDYTVFFNFLGVPSVDMLFDGPYGVYHSQYDSHYWMSRFGDPGFLYNRTMVSLWGILATRLANAEILPFDYEEYGKDLKKYVLELQPQAGELSLQPLLRIIEQFTATAAQSQQRIGRHLEGTVDPGAAREINRRLLQVERDFTDPEGIPGRPWFKHLIYAPLPSYEAETLPGLREALVEADMDRGRQQLEVLVRAVETAAKTLGGIQ